MSFQSVDSRALCFGKWFKLWVFNVQLYIVQQQRRSQWNQIEVFANMYKLYSYFIHKLLSRLLWFFSFLFEKNDNFCFCFFIHQKRNGSFFGSSKGNVVQRKKYIEPDNPLLNPFKNFIIVDICVVFHIFGHDN